MVLTDMQKQKQQVIPDGGLGAKQIDLISEVMVSLSVGL